MKNEKDKKSKDGDGDNNKKENLENNTEEEKNKELDNKDKDEQEEDEEIIDEDDNKYLIDVPRNCNFGIKLLEMRNFIKESDLSLEKEYKFYFEYYLADRREKSKVFKYKNENSSESDNFLICKTKFSLPFENIHNKARLILREENSLINSCEFLFDIENMKIPPGKILENCIILKEQNTGIEGPEIKLRMKIIIESEEELKLKIDRAESVLRNIEDYTSNLYGFKYELREVLSDQNDKKSFSEMNEWFNSMQNNEVYFFFFYFIITFFFFKK